MRFGTVIWLNRLEENVGQNGSTERMAEYMKRSQTRDGFT